MWLVNTVAHVMPVLVAMWDSGFYQTMPVFVDAFAPEDRRGLQNIWRDR